MKFDYSKTINEQLPTFEYYKDRYCSYELALLTDRKEIERLKEENEFLKLSNPEMNLEHWRVVDENKRKIENLRKQNKRLNNIINELENYIRARADDNNTCSICSVMADDLLNILKGSDNNE